MYWFESFTDVYYKSKWPALAITVGNPWNKNTSNSAWIWFKQSTTSLNASNSSVIYSWWLKTNPFKHIFFVPIVFLQIFRAKQHDKNKTLKPTPIVTMHSCWEPTNMFLRMANFLVKVMWPPLQAQAKDSALDLFSPPIFRSTKRSKKILCESHARHMLHQTKSFQIHPFIGFCQNKKHMPHALPSTLRLPLRKTVWSFIVLRGPTGSNFPELLDLNAFVQQLFFILRNRPSHWQATKK